MAEGIGDESMAQLFRDGRDWYTETVQGLYQITRQPTEEERQVGKTAILSLCYGGTWKTLHFDQGLPKQTAHDFYRNFHATWPGISVLAEVMNGTVEQRGYLLTPWGRHLTPEYPSKTIAIITQGSAADLMKWAMVNVDENMAGLDSHIGLVIHDELVIDAVNDDVPYLCDNVPEWMTWEPINEVVPIPVDVEISRTNWAAKSSWEGGDTPERTALGVDA